MCRAPVGEAALGQASATGDNWCASCSPHLSLDPLVEGRGLSPHGDVELSSSARSSHGGTAGPNNCSSCPGPPAASPPRPALRLLRLLLRTNVSYVQTLPWSPSGMQASPSPALGSGGTRLGKPGASQPPQSSPSRSPGTSTLPPASPGAPGPPPVTLEPSSPASGAQPASRQPSLPATVLTEASALSTMGPSPSETLVTFLRPHRLNPATSRLPAAPVTGASPGPQQPTTATSGEEEPAG